MSELRIESGIPAPVKKKIPRIPFEKMRPGIDSVLVPITKDSDKNTIRQRIYRFQERVPESRFIVESVGEDAVRVHRVADE